MKYLILLLWAGAWAVKGEVEKVIDCAEGMTIPHERRQQPTLVCLRAPGVACRVYRMQRGIRDHAVCMWESRVFYGLANDGVLTKW